MPVAAISSGSRIRVGSDHPVAAPRDIHQRRLMAREAQPPPAWLVRLNVWLLQRGLAVGSQVLLTVPGRRTGLPRSTPVSLATIGDDRYIVAAFPNADWVHNVRAAGSGTVSRGRSAEAVQIVEVAVDERAPVLRAFLRQVRGGRRFFGSPDADVVVAAAARYPVFRLTYQSRTLPKAAGEGRSQT
jgi:deazaflavin-dependent oxidoreductase (nitroreductase family)